MSISGMPDLTNHLWVCGDPFFSPSLYMVFEPGLSDGVSMVLFDADGEVSNEGVYSFPHGTVGVLDLAPLLGPLKLEQGFQHGHLMLEGPPESRYFVRLIQKKSATENALRSTPQALSRAPLPVKPREPVFFPLQRTTGVEQLVALVNPGPEPIQASLKLFAGQRSPEVTIEIPPRGSRISSMDHHFWSKLTTHEQDFAGQCYIRVSVGHVGYLATQFVEIFQEADSSVIQSVRLVS